MASAFKNTQRNPFFPKPPRPPAFSGAASTISVASTSAKPLIQNPSKYVLPSTSDLPITMSQEDEILGRSSHLTRTELLRRRSHNFKQLAKCYRDHYWALMEDIKKPHRDYWWKYGISPVSYEENQSNKRRKIGQEGAIGDNDTNNDDNDGNGVKNDQYANSNSRGCIYGCNLKAMALTKYCRLHIVKDSKQKLYTGCTYVIIVERDSSGPLLCGLPTLASRVPALCNSHLLKAKKHVAKKIQAESSY